MSNGQTSEGFKKAKEIWEKSREKYAAKIKERPNLSGIPIKSVYSVEDVQGLDLDQMPGVYMARLGYVVYPLNEHMRAFHEFLYFGV